jgi:hypothetical protein
MGTENAAVRRDTGKADGRFHAIGSLKMLQSLPKRAIAYEA